MQLKDLSSAYFNAWNAHDCAALRNTIAAGGFYSDPSVGQVSGKNYESSADPVWQDLPDLQFEVTSYAEISGTKLVAEWVMTGTNTTGSLNGLLLQAKPLRLRC